MNNPEVIVTKEEIKTIFIQNGFKEKIQSDNSLDLNPYVYDAAYALIRHALIKLNNDSTK